MKILLINDIGTATGGAEYQILSLRQGLRNLGHDARLFSSVATPVSESKLLADYSCFGTNTLLQVFSQTVNPSAYFELRHILREFQPDVVHIRMFMWQMSPAILALLKDVPCIYQTAVYKAICPVGTKILPDGSDCRDQPGKACLGNGCLTPQSWLVYMLQCKFWELGKDAIDVVVSLSQGMKAKLELAGIKPVEVIYNGVPITKKQSSLHSTPTVVFAGRIVPEKGIDILLKAFAQTLIQVPQARLLIAGEGTAKEELQALSYELEIADSVAWLGYLPQAEMEQHFAGAWVQVVPSQWAEPFGNVTTEAMMRGTATIASSVGAQPEIVVDGETGFLVNANDISAWTKAMNFLLSDSSLAQKMGNAGRARAIACFSEEQRNQSFLNLYQRVQKQYQQDRFVRQKLQAEVPENAIKYLDRN